MSSNSPPRPILFCGRKRLSEDLSIQQRELERVGALEGEGGVTHLRFRVGSEKR
jgi:hypothetical protein